MARRKLVTGLALVGASVGALAIWRRRSAGKAERVDLYYEDGSSVSLPDSAEGGERLLPLARRVLAAARA